jgi:hypothetical protein
MLWSVLMEEVVMSGKLQTPRCLLAAGLALAGFLVGAPRHAWAQG